MNEELSSHGIKLAYGEKVLEIKGSEKVEAVVTDKQEHKADMVILAVGFLPNVILGGEKLERFSNGAIKVQRNQETSEEGFFCCRRLC